MRFYYIVFDILFPHLYD